MRLAPARALSFALVVLTGACVPDLGSAPESAPDAAVPTASPHRPSASPEVPPVEPTPHPTPIPTPLVTQPPSAPPTLRVLLERRVSPVPRSVGDRAWEPVVATHPSDPKRVAVVYVHRGPGAMCSTNPVIRISRDGGRTWRRTGSSPGATSGRGMGLHPAIAWGPGPGRRARLYWTNMTSPGCGAGRFSLTTAYSDDDGKTWSKLRVEKGTPPWVGGFPEIAVDRHPDSPNRGVVYVGYNWLRRGAHGPGFRLLASTDHGRSWHRVEVPPAKLATGARDWWRIAYRIRTGPDGTVYATWYQVDLRRWDRSNIFAKGGQGNVRRLGVAIARIRFDRRGGTFDLDRSRIAAKVAESPWTTSGQSASGTSGNVRPDPMWQYGFDVDDEGGLHVAVGGYGSSRPGRPRGVIHLGRSDDGGRSWTTTVLPAAADIAGRRQSSLRPNLVAGPGYVLVTMRLLDDVGRDATLGAAVAVSTDGGRRWTRPRPLGDTRWRAASLGGVVNGVGLRERAELTAAGAVVWAFGDARLAGGSKPGRTAIFATVVSPEHPTR